ncbi:hypothetical protein KIN20_015853 [Parelaphostrongylus tenuis]|uniref:Uncharacterized protein n=1 Tax=Parelaphostrongylus tenuis TaxID=148309 RepID=A0AAD5MZ30_PARTN|nr:hypothetical protein KIN20_015853 [Parelaphostrongylus tenuis]
MYEYLKRQDFCRRAVKLSKPDTRVPALQSGRLSTLANPLEEIIGHGIARIRKGSNIICLSTNILRSLNLITKSMILQHWQCHRFVIRRKAKAEFIVFLVAKF